MIRVLFALLLSCACPDGAPAALHWAAVSTLDAPARALAETDGGWLAATRSGLVRSANGVEWTEVEGTGLAEGDITWLGRVEGDVVLASVYGAGLYRSTDGGGTWAAVGDPPSQPLLALFQPRGLVAPFALARSGDATWLAALGGLFRSDDDGATWDLADLSSSGRLNVLFTGVAAEGDRIVAVSQDPASLLPADMQGLLGGTVFVSADGGETWAEEGDLWPTHAPTAVAFVDGEACLGTMDAGLLCEGVAETDLSDVVALEASDGALSVASASRGVQRWSGGAWTGEDAGPIASLAGDLALATNGTVLAVVAGEGVTLAPAAGGTVHLALSFHVNLYHSYRGDTPDDDGYGQDIDVIRTTLDWLDANPGVRADWDVENHFSLDGWLASDAPDITERIASRVAAGTDDVRIMSWNNGAMADETAAEFAASVRWAQESYDVAFARQVPSVQPQECMLTADHIGAYRDLGVDWITLFYSATPFTAMRADHVLDGADAFNPVTLRDAVTGDSMVWVPA